MRESLKKQISLLDNAGIIELEHCLYISKKAKNYRIDTGKSIIDFSKSMKLKTPRDGENYLSGIYDYSINDISQLEALIAQQVLAAKIEEETGTIIKSIIPDVPDRIEKVIHELKIPPGKDNIIAPAKEGYYIVIHEDGIHYSYVSAKNIPLKKNTEHEKSKHLTWWFSLDEVNKDKWVDNVFGKDKSIGDIVNEDIKKMYEDYSSEMF